MDTFDFHVASEATKTRTAHIAVGVFFLILFLLVLLFFLAKFVLDKEDIKKDKQFFAS